MTERDADLNALVDGTGPIGARLIGLHTLAKEARDERDSAKNLAAMYETLNSDVAMRQRAEAAERDLAETRAALERLRHVANCVVDRWFQEPPPSMNVLGRDIGELMDELNGLASGAANLESPVTDQGPLRKEGENTNG